VVQSTTIHLDGHDIKITRPEKVLFPEDGVTKGDLIAYYQRVAPWILPHLEGRPLTFQRFPDGIDKAGFFQKSAGAYYPAWIQRATMEKTGGTVSHVVCENAATLVYLANQACVALHTALSRADKPHHPDLMIFDLDPSKEDDLPAVIQGALWLKELLEARDLPAFVKTTGSRGLHVVVPLDAKRDFGAVLAFAHSLAELLVERDPEHYTLEFYKNKREDRVFVDVNRNAYAQTAVAAYSVRARQGAPVAVPLPWSELRHKNLRPDGVTIRNAFERLEHIEDPWKDFWKVSASLPGSSPRAHHS
jgi:bifunctional non-homologous end joining protein LigD